MSCVLRTARVAIAAVVAVGALACESSLAPFSAVGGSVVTLVDDGAALSSARTFAIADTIVDVPLRSEAIDHASDREIVGKIRAHFVALGWRDVSHDATGRPDVLVLVAASTRTQAGFAYDNWYGAWGYLPYWDDGVNATWAWGMPGGEIPYVYDAGTLLVTMLDLRNQDAEARRVLLLWAAAIDGFVTGEITTKERVLEGIDQAFAQSSYLKVP